MASEILASAVRRIKRRPGTAIAIASTLAIGLAISTTSFSLFYGIVLKSLPFPDGDRITRIFSHNPRLGTARSGLTPAEAADGLDQLDSFSITGFSHLVSFITVVTDDGPRQLDIVGVSRRFFSVYGLPAELGRTFVEDEFTANEPVAVLSHGAWTELGRDPEIVGQQVRHLDGALLVVGVLPQSFDSLGTSTVYLPTPYLPRNNRLLRGIGRIREGVSIRAATVEINSRFTAMALDQDGSPQDGRRFELIPLIDLTVGPVRPILVAVFTIALLVFAVAALTAMTLVSVRLGRRLSDLAIERALGASRTRIAMESATELAILVVGAVAAGWSMSMAAIRSVVLPFAADILPRGDNIASGALPLVFACSLAALAALTIGVMPIRRVLADQPAPLLNAGPARQILHSRSGLVPSVSVALTTVSLMTALSLTTSLIRESSIDLGFETENIGAISMVRRQPQAELDQFLQAALTEIRVQPGVLGVAAVLARSPVSPYLLLAPVATQTGDPVQVDFQAASAGYHSLMGIPVIEGRDIASTDTLDAPRVAVINETMARMFFGARSPINETLLLSGDTYQVVGMAADRKNAGARAPTAPEFVISLHQWGGPAATILVKYDVLRSTWAAQAVNAIRGTDSYQVVSRTFTLDEELERLSLRARFFANVTWILSFLALAMGGFGTFAVVAAIQAGRTRDTSLRIALGERPIQAAARVLFLGIRIVALGLALGLLISVPVLRQIEADLFLGGIGTLLTIGVVISIGLLLTGIAAGIFPAARAFRTDASTALRES
jgi:putative ABC transport system permease protein